MASQTDHHSSAEIDSPSLEKGEGAKNIAEIIPEGQTEKLPEVPEGSLKAYLAVVGAFSAMFVSFGFVNCIALFQAEYETNQLKQYTSSQVSWITSTEFFFMLFISPLAGRMFDNYGPRLPIAIGTVMHVFGLMMASLSTKYYQFVLSQSVCSGIGASLIFSPAMTAPMTYFKKNRAIAGGLAIAGSSLGGVIFPIMAVHLIPRIGFPWTMRACAFMILGLLVITNFTISSNNQHVPRPFKLSQYLGPLQETNFLIMCLSSFFIYWGMFIPLNYLVISTIRYGMSTTMAINLIPILNGASFIGRTVPNVLADKYGRFNVMTIMVLFSVVIILGLWIPGRSNAAMITFAALFGIGSGAVIGLGPVLIMNISPMNEVGYRMGTVFAIAGLGTLTSPPIGGAIAADSGAGKAHFATVITGCNEGIGFWFARVALKQGYTTYATSRTNGPKLKQLQSEGAKISVLDVSSEESIQAFKKTIGDTAVDVLINNAAICDRDHEALTTTSMSALESAFRTNAFGPLILTQALLSNLTAVPNSRIGNITSRVGSIADNTGGSFYGYRGSKAALNMIGKSMAVDLKEKGVVVAMVHPGMVATPGSGAKVGQPQVIEPQEAADKCWDMLIKMGIEDTGKFWHREGYEIPW